MTFTEPSGLILRHDLKIDPEFRDLIKPLSPEEYMGLEKSIRADGCRDPLVMWNNTIVDGHHRHGICQTYAIPFRTVSKNFKTRDDAKLWIVANQNARRNTTPAQKVANALKIEPIIAARAKENQRAAGGTVPQKPAKPIDTRSEIARIAGTSTDTVSKVKAVLEKAPADVAERMLSGEVSVNKTYTDVIREELKKERIANLVANPPMPNGKYNVILADPPWKYEFHKTGEQDVENQYPTMTFEELAELDAPFDDNAILFLWTTAPKLDEAISVMCEWGFTYRSCMVWDKEWMGMGYYARIQHELILIGIKGEFRAPETENRPVSVIRVRRGAHSEKPAVVYDIIEKMYPHQKYLELFARGNRQGWMSWGNAI